MNDGVELINAISQKAIEMLNKMKTKLRALLRKSQMERELDEELRDHVDRQTEQNIRFGMTPEEARYAARNAVSLDEEVPQNETQDAVEEALYEFRQPFDVTTYENLIAGSAPADVEIAFNDGRHSLDQLTEEERAFLEREDLDLSSDARQVVLFHDEFALTLPEVAQILDYSLKDTAEALSLARTTLRVG